MRRQLGHCDLEPRLDLVHDVLVRLGRDERDRKTLGAEPTRTSVGEKYQGPNAGTGA